MPRPNPNTPMGLRRIQRAGSADYRDSLAMFYVAPGSAAALFDGDPIVRVTGVADANGVQGVALAAAGATHAITGVVCGFVPQFGLSGQPGPLYVPAGNAQGYYVLCSTDPADEYMVQENDNFGGVANTPLPVTAVGKNADLVAGAGSVYTGWSGWQLDANTVADGATHQLTIIGFVGEADNVPGALYGKLKVRINLSTEAPGAVGV